MIDSMDVQPSDVVRDLGVLLDSELTLKHHVNRIASTCFYHLHRLRQLKRYVGVKVMKQLISSFIFSRLDYCNALLIGLPFSTIAHLQRVQNAAARLLLGLSQRDHVRPAALKEIHWLPVMYRIQFKLALVMFTIHTRRCPDYLTDSVQACRCNSDPARTRLRSASSSDYTVPRTRTRLGERAFSVAGPVYQQQFVKLTACIRLGASSKHICLLYVLMTNCFYKLL